MMVFSGTVTAFADELPEGEASAEVSAEELAREKEAEEKAAEEAKNYFNICPHCGEMICDDCFLICEDIDICRSCAESLKETGEPISFAGWVAG
jgi:formylmethanofuran dehydrogenase subunit E